ncbi:MAG: hypothetical protein AAGI66_02975 [Cyanobacteria bacterium P01_H01_bin.74]
MNTTFITRFLRSVAVVICLINYANAQTQTPDYSTQVQAVPAISVTPTTANVQANIQSDKLLASENMSQPVKTIPVYLYGALRKQHKIEIPYTNADETYVIDVVLDALSKADGFSERGTDYVKIKLQYEKTYTKKKSRPNQGIREVSFKYSFDGSEISEKRFFRRKYDSKFPQKHPLWFYFSKTPFFFWWNDSNNHLGRNLNVAGVNDDTLRLKKIIVFAPVASTEHWRNLFDGIVSSSVTGAIAGATAGASN